MCVEDSPVHLILADGQPLTLSEEVEEHFCPPVTGDRTSSGDELYASLRCLPMCCLTHIAAQCVRGYLRARLCGHVP